MDRRIELLISRMQGQLSKSWNTALLGKVVNLSSSRLRHLFKEETGQTPSQYLKRLRLKQAEHLLGTTFLTIKEVASEVGLSTGNLDHEFKLKHNCTPGEYRARLSSIKIRS